MDFAEFWNQGAEVETRRARARESSRSLENIKNWPRDVKAVFYTVVKGLNAYDRETTGVRSPLNGEIAAEVAWAEHDKGGKR